MEKSSITEGEYIVFLPKDVQVDGYDMIPKIEKTSARSEGEAVKNVVFRAYTSKRFGLTKEMARIRSRVVISKLEEIFGGASKYAVLIPKVDQMDLIDYVLAEELATKNNSRDTEKYLQKSRFLLKAVGLLN